MQPPHGGRTFGLRPLWDCPNLVDRASTVQLGPKTEAKPTVHLISPETRVVTPDPQIWAEAGLIARTLAHTQNFQRHQRKECLNDALIFLTAARVGLPVLTVNRGEFDVIQQLAPQGSFIYY